MLLTGLEAGVHLLEGLQRMHLIVERTLQEPKLLRKLTHFLGHLGYRNIAALTVLDQVVTVFAQGKTLLAARFQKLPLQRKSLDQGSRFNARPSSLNSTSLL